MTPFGLRRARRFLDRKFVGVARGWFPALCAAVAIERLLELRWSRAHARTQARRGGSRVREPAFLAMVLLHGAVLIAAPIESRLRPPARHPRLRNGALIVLALATALRVWTLRALGDAWSVRVTRFPDGARPVVTRGPYRFVRHPNYAAVILELMALPLAGGAFVTATVASAANALVLARRIGLEERELRRDEGWRAAMEGKPRFLPWSKHG